MRFLKRKRAVLLTVAIGTFMSALDSSVVNMALPSISAYFQTTLATVEWIIMSYLLVISSLLLAYGRLGDMFGHRRIYLLGFVIFTAGSVLCGLAPTILLLIFFRGIQAVGAGMLMAVGPAIVTDTAPPEQRGKALSITAVAVAIALTTGPVLGGILTTVFGWQSIFLINIPIGIVGFWLAKKTIPEKPDLSIQPFDFWGAVLIFTALISILLPLSLVERLGWNNLLIILAIGFGFALAVCFVILEQRSAFPLFDIKLFKNRQFSMSNLAALLNYMAQFMIILLIPFYLQRLRGLPPAEAGLLYFAMPLTTMVVAPISGILSDRMDSRYLGAAGMMVMAVGMGLLSNLKIDSTNLFLITGLTITGLGIGLFQTPNNSAIMGSVPGNRRGIASGMLATMRNMGMVLGVAISGALFSASNHWFVNLLQKKGLSGAQLEQTAFINALGITYSVGAGLALIAAIISLAKGRINPQRQLDCR